MDTPDKRFLKAAQAGDLDEAKRLLAESPSVVHARSTTKGYTALHFAAHGCHVEMIKPLIEAKAPVDARNGKGLSAAGQGLERLLHALGVVPFDPNVQTIHQLARDIVRLTGSSSAIEHIPVPVTGAELADIGITRDARITLAWKGLLDANRY